MATNIRLQRLLGIECVAEGTGEQLHAQPIEDWLDLMDAEDITLSSTIYQRKGSTTSVTLCIQTATVPEGPWTDVDTFSGTSTIAETRKLYLSRHGWATDKFERYLRWAIKVPGGETYKVCFKIDAVVR